ncbi:DNA polymerase IV [Chloroflexota bacterium]
MRKIIHVDLDAFYCAVEEQLNPDLRGKAFAVGGMPGSRGVVASCSYAARRFGVSSAMPMTRALQLCPELQVLPWHRSEYSNKSRQVMKILHEFTDLVEQISIDEAFLDVSARKEPPGQIAQELQTRIQDQEGLPASLGVATSKLVAKIATDVGKSAEDTHSYPNAIQVVPLGEEADFLAPLPAQILWGVGPKTFQALEDLGLYTIGAVANWPEKDFIQRFGQLGKDLSRRAKGIDDSPVYTRRETKSISQETTFSEDINDKQKLLSIIQKQSKSIETSLSKENLKGITIKIKLRWPNFETLNRQITLEAPTADAEEIYKVAENLFLDNWKPGFPVRLIGIGISGFSEHYNQLSLWKYKSRGHDAEVESVLKSIRDKYGADTIQRGLSKIV